MSRDDPFTTIDRLQLENDHLLETVQSMEETRSVYATLFEVAPIPYVILDGAGALQEVNQAAAELLAMPNDRPHLRGKRLRGYVHDDDERTLTSYLRQCAETEQVATCELRLRDGTPVRLWSRPTPTTPRRYATVIADLLKRDRAKEEVRRLAELGRLAQQESEAKDRFIAALSHELRTPLTPVLTAVSALLDRTDMPASMRPVCEMIRATSPPRLASSTISWT